MAASMKSLAEAFRMFHRKVQEPEFAKTHRLLTWSERDLLLPVRCYLLGWFGAVDPEAQVRLPTALTGTGRVDFMFGETAVELAVRPRDVESPACLGADANADEVRKLSLHDGPSMLVLLDFARRPVDDEFLNRYRSAPSMGRGRWGRSPFHVFYIHNELDPWLRKVIRTSTSR